MMDTGTEDASMFHGIEYDFAGHPIVTISSKGI
jgi:hypothetical protein